jgi:hypothetical protein
MQKLTKYQTKIINILLKDRNAFVLKYPSGSFYLSTFKRKKETRTILRESMIGIVIESSRSWLDNEDRGIYGLEFDCWQFEEYCQRNEIPIRLNKDCNRLLIKNNSLICCN